MKKESEVPKVSQSDILKFVVISFIGVFLFMIPIPYKEGFNIPVGIIIDWVKEIIKNYTMYIVLILTGINAIISLIAYIFKPKFIMENKGLRSQFVTTPLYLVSRVIGAIVAFMVYLSVGPEIIISGATGGTMVDLAMGLMSIFIVTSYLMPLITDFGIMEFSGILIRGIVKPLFTVPGRSAVDLITSWFGASNAAVLLTDKQYNTGYYSRREAAVIMTNFSLVSVPFCYIIASVLGIERLFVPFYLITTVVGIILAMITPRIPPLSKLPDTYNEETGKLVVEEVPEGESKFKFAVKLAALRARNSTFKDALKSGNEMMLGVMFSLTPIIIAWGTISLILVEHTSLFNILATPLGHYLNILGIEEAFKVAPATLVGFADMFIPALILSPIESVATKFIIGSLSLVQIIYLTEVGIIIMQSKIKVGFLKLLVIFLERTIIALPIITLLAKLVL